MNNGKWNLSSKWILTISLLVFLLPIISVEYDVLSFTHGIFSYPFDDTFIHMAISKNIAFHGIWGISPHEFSSASSSVLYPLLLAGGFKLFGVWTGLPLVLNLLAGITLIFVVQKWLTVQGLNAIPQLITLLGLILLTPLPALVVFGMEHTLQLLFDFLFIYHFAAAWGKTETNDKISLPWTVYLYGALVMATRYEGLFLIAMACLILVTRSLSRKNIGEAFQLGLISFLPIILFGVYALSKGSYFIPNSVLVKSTAPPMTIEGLTGFISEGLYSRLYFFHPTIGGIAIQRLLIILPLGYLFLKEKTYRCILLLLTGITLLHLLFASTSVLFRYEAYLVGCSIPILGVLAVKLVARWKSHRLAVSFLLLILAIPVVLRSKAAFELIGQGSINIYEQQYQMGQFVHRYYNDTPVAMGDIGAISFFSQGKNLDLEGLGNLDVARSRKNNYWTPDFLDALSRHDSIRIAIVFDRSYPAELRDRWQKIATWQIPNNVACYSDVVSFYAVDSTAGRKLEENLKGFQARLPADVIVRYR